MSIRGLDTEVRKTRKQIFKEVANLAYHSENIIDDLEALPYKLSDADTPRFWENIYRERAVTRERLRLAMGLSLRPENKPVHATRGVDESDIAEKYYEPPLMQVIPSACNACAENKYVVTDQCKACTAHPCAKVCPRQAISFVDGKSYINQDLCVKCGKCKQVCPYDAISKQVRPCALACGVNAIQSDEYGRACIDNDKCVKCGMCMVHCPFGAIADKSQIFQLIRAIQSEAEVIAIIAPAFVGQFGENVTPAQIKEGLKQLGFAGVYEVAIGADMGAMAEAKHYVHMIESGEPAFLLTSCCPSWSVLAKKFFPETMESISNELTPMVATARKVKEEHPDAKVVFIGPCASKKLEASRKSVRSEVDFVITFEELDGMFEAKEIVLPELETDESDEIKDATSAGRGYAVAGGVAGAIEACIKEYYPEVEVHIEHAEGLSECKKILALAKAGKKNGCLIEGMGCQGGCVGGAGTNIPIPKANAQVKKFVNCAEKKLPEMTE